MIVLEDTSERIDVYLSKRVDLSRSKIQKLIKSGDILVNGNSISSNYNVKLNDDITINYHDETTSVIPEDIPIDVVYEDDYLLVINKKSGMVVHPAPGHYRDTLVNALLYRYNIKGGDSLRPGIVHRLDKDTSGLMLVAKTEKVHDELSSMISKKEVERHYLAIVDGVIKNETGTIDAPIGRDSNNRQKMKVTDINGKDAITNFRVLERFNNNTLIECILETGRTHQIRVHMAYIGYPVSNDPLYGRGKCTEFGQMLHSYYIKFCHPVTGEVLEFRQMPPKEFMDKLESLRSETNE